MYTQLAISMSHIRGLATFLEIDHEIFSMIILSLLLIQEGQWSISGKRMCTSTA